VITDIARRELKSHRQLPVNFYQIQTKFRDEIRPRFGVMRAREFVMKDAYSFHIDQASLEQGYRAMYAAYSRIFERMQLRFRAVGAYSGSIGGSVSQEFHVLAESGEDAIAFSDSDEYAANLEMAEALAPPGARAAPGAALAEVSTPGVRTIAELTVSLGVSANRCVKTLLVDGVHGEVIALVVRGDHELNAVKVQRLPGVLAPLRMTSAERVREATGCEPGFLGTGGPQAQGACRPGRSRPRRLRLRCQSPRPASHGRQLGPRSRGARGRRPAERRAGRSSPTGRGHLSIVRGIEVGHIFQLGAKYSEAMNATVLDDGGRAVTMLMGCYGIGVTRVVAAAIEQNHDERGIIWPDPIAPFDVSLIPINLQKSPRVREISERLYDELRSAGFEVLYDDRDARPGVKFADDELLGIPAPGGGRRQGAGPRSARIPRAARDGVHGRTARAVVAVAARAYGQDRLKCRGVRRSPASRRSSSFLRQAGRTGRPIQSSAA
jgi:prolyl-tRNA synthetase